MEILSIDALKIGYNSGKEKKVLLPPLTARANKGELIAIIGRNGIGKSTLLRTLVGIQPSMGGAILYDNKNIVTYSRIDLARKVGYISTEIIKVANMSVYDLVALGRFPHTSWIGKIDPINHEFITHAIENTGMSAFSARFITELSDGERQRAMIARILAQDAGVMVMDEPTAFLDIGSKYEILHLMHILSQQSEKCIIFSTHDLQMAINMADKIWLITDENLKEGAPEDLMIDGAFDHLFDSSLVRFNSENGTFSSLNKGMRSIFVDGEGMKKYWTEKALSRIGFLVSEVKTNPYISVPAYGDINWHLISQNTCEDFPSLYDLVSRLSRTNELLTT
jgi:iron complex transport system ATP-binding protein